MFLTIYTLDHQWEKDPFFRLSNSVGIIDSGYRGNIMAIVDNLSDEIL